MDVSVIIVNYNTLQLTKECIDSVFQKTKGIEFEVILVDNASTDGSREYFSNDERIKYVYNDENVGFGKANNIGYAVAKGDFLFLLNSDTYLLNNAIGLMYETYKKADENKDIACAGCMLSYTDGKIVHSYGVFPNYMRVLMNYTVFPVCYRLGIIKNTPSSSNIDYEGKKNLLYFDVDYITGADLFIKKTVADSYGLFDADFFMYWEETEMQFRYMKHGCRRIIINGPRIVHLEGGSNRLNSPSKKTRIMRSYFLYLKKTTTKFNFIFYITTFKAFYLLFNIISYPFINGSFAEKYKHIVDIVKMKV